MSVDNESDQVMDQHMSKVVQSLVIRSLKMRGKNKIAEAANFISEAIAAAPVDSTEIVLPANFITPAILSWISKLGLEVHDKNKLAIPTTSNPFANCHTFQSTIEMFDTENAPARREPTPQPVDQTPAQPSRKRKLVEPGAPVAERRNVSRKESVEPRRIDFADQSPEKDAANDKASQAELPPVEISQEEKQRKVEQWTQRERSLEKELMDAIVSRDSATDEDTRRIREDKVSIARRNYRSAVKALEMAQQSLEEQKK